mmetsp:Transcript_7088/g.16512  ORF Transcript_7088/g.16512 Transcript_7088/m.16512 type:complete len:202 (+) Transcript_7088:1868-2473(+)
MFLTIFSTRCTTRRRLAARSTSFPSSEASTTITTPHPACSPIQNALQFRPRFSQRPCLPSQEARCYCYVRDGRHASRRAWPPPRVSRSSSSWRSSCRRPLSRSTSRSRKSLRRGIRSTTRATRRHPRRASSPPANTSRAATWTRGSSAGDKTLRASWAKATQFRVASRKAPQSTLVLDSKQSRFRRGMEGSSIARFPRPAA